MGDDFSSLFLRSERIVAALERWAASNSHPDLTKPSPGEPASDGLLRTYRRTVGARKTIRSMSKQDSAGRASDEPLGSTVNGAAGVEETMNGPPGHHRRSARVIVVDEQERVLLIRIDDPHDGRPAAWITPGGGLEEGERLVDAAIRELREETGLAVTPGDLGSPVARCRGGWVFRGTTILSDDVFFALHTAGFEPDPTGWTELEAEVHDGWRWCALDELDHLDGAVLPSGLAGVIESIVAGRRPPAPVELPWRTL